MAVQILVGCKALQVIEFGDYTATVIVAGPSGEAAAEFIEERIVPALKEVRDDAVGIDNGQPQ